MEFPMYFSIYSQPGYDSLMLGQFGFHGETQLFSGRISQEEDQTVVSWGNGTVSIAGKGRFQK